MRQSGARISWRMTGAQAAMLSLGGNVQTVGSKPDGSPWQVGIADPKDPSSAIAVRALYRLEGPCDLGRLSALF